MRPYTIPPRKYRVDVVLVFLNLTTYVLVTPVTKSQSNWYDRKAEVVDKKVGKERTNTDKVIYYRVVVDGRVTDIWIVWSKKLVATT